MNFWHCLLLVYPRIEVALPDAPGGSRRFAYEMSDGETADAVDSFRCLPALVSDLTDQAAGITHDIVTSERTLSSLTQWRPGYWWPSPDDIAPELGRHTPPGKYDSIFVLWPPNHLRGGESIETGAWGLGMAASPWSRGATYAAVANAGTRAWQIPLMGEVWLHEWLHGVCAHFAQRGHPMPSGDADGGDRHGYTRSPTTGWTGFYRDLMNGNVIEDGRGKGIPRVAWSRAFDERD